MDNADVVETDVLIVGAGGCGLALSVFLSDLGVDHVQIERHSSTALQPKASYLNQRTMEIFRQHDLADAVRAVGCPQEHMEQVRWCTSLGGDDPTDARTLATMSIFGAREMHEAWTAASPSITTNLPQIRLEPLLEEHATARAGRPALRNHELLDWVDGPDAITASVLDRGSANTTTIRARYLVAADGGRTIGPRLGIPMLGPTRLKDFVSVYFAADLSAWADDSTLITFLLNPEGSGMRNSGGLMQLGPTWGAKSEEWVLHFGQEIGAASFDETTIVPHIRTLLKTPGIDIEVHKISHWILDRIVAERYRQGRILLVGDAAHRQPPMSGLGLNSGIHDAHNLAWKLAAVVGNKATDELLDSYDAERRPIGIRNADWALMASSAQSLIDANLGLQPGMGVDAARKALSRLLADTPTGAAMRWRAEQVIATLGLEFHCHDMEIGYYYDVGALVPDGTAAPQVDPAHSHYSPTTRPGHRLPHAWLTGPTGAISTHDLVGRDGGLVLITGQHGAAWTDAAHSVERELGVSIHMADIGFGCTYNDDSGAWEALHGINSDGAILVRPDNHVGWRCSDAVEDPRSTLLKAVSQVLRSTSSMKSSIESKGRD